MNWTLILSIFQGTITAGTSILFATLGGIVCGRAGLNNMGIEGIMLMGAITGYGVTATTGNPWVGLGAALLVGAAFGLAYAFFAVGLRGSHVVTGLAFVGLGVGLSGYLGKQFVGLGLPATFTPVEIPLLSDIPIIGPILFNQDPLVYLSWALVIGLWRFLFRSRPGLHLRAVGENPAAADNAGINVSAIRYLYTAVGSALVGAGGAYLSLAYSPLWVEGLTAGRGWIAVALVVFAGWNPAGALLGAYLFGGVDATTLRLQAIGAKVEPFLLNALPYLFTILVLILASAGKRRATAPAALGQSYDREMR
jgi:general nucleoside transport system permease protein